ncbi:uncharacterized protein EV420DRAFT_1642491 [Desarmillaria tabescens]|uniref:Uncharacterized protein n=1 Tax=Armillaria tabescens TaxID=1929756 RepID=A0AA39KCU0_ARMTA|nr:uncharacterized protein EV420DRAFT_1642491 [Desarmillaria tabescens]KAK0458770.1 hypothetical protein EV420DRAFT_1642491 [Desarmillaria tabescens]
MSTILATSMVMILSLCLSDSDPDNGVKLTELHALLFPPQGSTAYLVRVSEYLDPSMSIYDAVTSRGWYPPLNATEMAKCQVKKLIPDSCLARPHLDKFSQLSP